MHSIAHVLPSSRDAGGLSAAVRALDEAGLRRGLDSRVVAAVPDGASPSRWPFGRPADAEALVEALRTVDGVVLHGVFQADVARAGRLIARRLPRVPVIRMPHDPYDDGLFASRRLLKRAWFLLVERPGLERSRAVFTTAPSHERWLRARGVRARVVTHPLGLSPAEHADAQETMRRRGAWASRSPAVLVQIGRWDVEEKGLDLAVAAAAQLGGAAVRLRVVGPPEGSREALERLVRVAGAPVELVGFVPSVWEEIAGADLLLMPSRKEGFGLAALQALSAGLPVVLTNRAGLAELVGRSDGCVLASPDVAAVVTAVRDALSDLPALNGAARGFARERSRSFTSDAVLDKLLLAFDRSA